MCSVFTIETKCKNIPIISMLVSVLSGTLIVWLCTRQVAALPEQSLSSNSQNHPSTNRMF